MIGGNDGGATVTVNGSPWTQQNNAADVGDLPAGCGHPLALLGVRRAAGQLHHRGAELQVKASPTPVGGGESGHIAVDPRDFNIIYAGNYGGTI